MINESANNLQFSWKNCSCLTNKIQRLRQACSKVDDVKRVVTSNDSESELSGDQAIDNELFSYFRVGLKWDVFPEKLWPNRTIPYAISPLYEPEDMITILSAIRTLSAMTCVKFVKWTGKQDDFLLIWPIKYPKVRVFELFSWFEKVIRKHFSGMLVFCG